MSIEDQYNRTFSLEDKSGTGFNVDVGGGFAPRNNKTMVKDEPCRLRLLRGSEQSLVGSEGDVTSHRLYCSALIDITSNDEVVMDDGLRYDVDLPDDPHGLGHHLQVDLIRRTKGEGNF